MLLAQDGEPAGVFRVGLELQVREAHQLDIRLGTALLDAPYCNFSLRELGALRAHLCGVSVVQDVEVLWNERLMRHASSWVVVGLEQPVKVK